MTLNHTVRKSVLWNSTGGFSAALVANLSLCHEALSIFSLFANLPIYHKEGVGNCIYWDFNHIICCSLNFLVFLAVVLVLHYRRLLTTSSSNQCILVVRRWISLKLHRQSWWNLGERQLINSAGGPRVQAQSLWFPGTEPWLTHCHSACWLACLSQQTPISMWRQSWSVWGLHEQDCTYGWYLWFAVNRDTHCKEVKKWLFHPAHLALKVVIQTQRTFLV